MFGQVSFVITDHPSLDYLERKEVCLGLQFWESKGTVPASAKLPAEAMCSFKSGWKAQGKHGRKFVMVREQEYTAPKKSLLPLSGLFAFLRLPPLNTFGLRDQSVTGVRC